MGDVLAFQPPARMVSCEGCGRAFMTSDLPPYLCGSCEADANAAIDAELEATARAAGFASFDAFIEHEMRAAEMQETSA